MPCYRFEPLIRLAIGVNQAWPGCLGGFSRELSIKVR
jgi:hypothetical protein